MRYRMKRLLAELLSAVILLSLLPATALAAGDFTGADSGDGSSGAPYQISTAEQLRQLSEYVNGGKDCTGLFFKLTADIDLGGEGNQWTPIGNANNRFKGSFDGGNHTVCVYIDSPVGTIKDLGFFGYIDTNGAVKNLGVSGSIDGSGIGDSYVGGIAGQNYGTIENCYNTATVTGPNTVGGIVGNTSGSLQNCYNTGAVSSGWYAGGVVGEIRNGQVQNCYNTGTVSGNAAGGGIVGNILEGNCVNCYNTGHVEGTPYQTGGLAGSGNAGRFTNCYYLDSTAEHGVPPEGTNDESEKKTAGEFRSLASLLNNGGDAWEDDPFLGRPVLKANKEPWPISGSGTESDPYLIPDKETLEKVRNYVNAGNNCKDMYFRLTENINLESQEWTPIGENSGDPFKGTFDGGEFTVRGLYVNTSNYGGLFGYLEEGGTVKNLTVEGNVTGLFNVGGIVGQSNGGTIDNCHNAATVTSTEQAGGIVGFSSGGTVTNCYNTAAVTGSSQYIGGIVGHEVRGSVTNCYNTATVTGGYAFGGIIGYNSIGTVTNCYYLDTLAEDTTSTPKTADEFASGEVAYLLQNGQDPQAWGQTVGSGTPELTNSEDKKVFKITGEVEDQADVVWYSNSKATLPTTEPTKAGFTFAGWSTEEEGTEADFEKGVTVSDDMTVYAVFTDQRLEGVGTVTMADYTCGDNSVEPVAESATNGTANVTFTYSVWGLEEYSETKPTTAGEYTVKAVFAATEDYREVTATADFKITHQFNAGWEQREDGKYHLCACGAGLLLETKELTEVPEGLKQNPDVDTVEEIEQVLVEKVATGNHYVIYDVELEAWIGDEWQIITPENLPEEGVAITIPYPEGTNSRYTFTVVHMFTTDGDGHAPGDTEVLEATNETDGIHFTVKSFSPIIIGWKTGNLTVTVTDTGESADPARQWQFRVELSDTEITGQYGDMSFTDGVATFALQSGQSLTARDLPEGLAYTVTEIKANQDGYTTTYTGDSGLISSEQDMVAAFINDKPAQAKPDKPSPDDSDDKPDTPTDTPPDMPTSNNSDDTPKTGDESHLALWLSLMILSLIGITVTALTPIIGRKKLVSANGRHVRK